MPRAYGFPPLSPAGALMPSPGSSSPLFPHAGEGKATPRFLESRGELKDEDRAPSITSSTSSTRPKKTLDECWGGCCHRESACGRCRCWCVAHLLDRIAVALLVLSIISLLISVLAPGAINSILESGIDDSVVINEDSNNFASFIDSGENQGVEIYYTVRYFNLTNAEAVLTEGQPPAFVEVGPYTYRQHQKKLNVTFSSNGDQVSFYLQKLYEFDAAHSGPGLSEDDVIGTLNLVTQGLKQALRGPVQETLETLMGSSSMHPPPREGDRKLQAMDFSKLLLKAIMCAGPDGVSPFTTIRARDWYFGRTQDPLLSITKDVLKNLGQDVTHFTTTFQGVQPNYTSEADALRRAGLSMIHTGQINKGLINEFMRFQNMTMLHVCPDASKCPNWDEEEQEMPACCPYQEEWTDVEALRNGWIKQWDSDEANLLQGTDGSLYPHPINSQSLWIFIDDLRRIFGLSYTGEVHWRGLKLRRYTMAADTFMNTDAWPSNDGYYQYGPNGLGNLTKTSGFPFFLSKPHFLGGDPSLTASVRGLTPNPDLHDTYLDLEPYTGTCLRTTWRNQLSGYLTDWGLPTPGQVAAAALVTALGFPREQQAAIQQCLMTEVTWVLPESQAGIYFPCAWFDQSVELPPSLTEDLKGSVYGAVDLRDGLELYGPILSGLLFLAAIIVAIISFWQKKKESSPSPTEAGYLPVIEEA